jgi:hypothetical protein
MATTNHPLVQSGFMRIPVEIRLIIYELLLQGDDESSSITIQSEPHVEYLRRRQHQRTSYRVLGPGIQRQSLATIYCLTEPSTRHTSILAVNRKIHHEASYILYGKHSFEFGNSIEAIVPFLSDLTPSTRLLIQDISLTKIAHVYARDFDNCEWTTLCAYLSQHMVLRKLTLRIVGGQPLRNWEPEEYEAGDFKTLLKAGFDGLHWVEELLQIKRLKHLELISELKPCPPPVSSAMAFFAAFSASIDKGFSKFLRSEMLST